MAGKGQCEVGHTILYSGWGSNRYKNSIGFLVNNSKLPNTKSFMEIIEKISFIHIEGKIWDIVLFHCWENEIERLYNKPHISLFLKAKWFEGAGYVWWAGTKCLESKPRQKSDQGEDLDSNG